MDYEDRPTRLEAERDEAEMAAERDAIIIVLYRGKSIEIVLSGTELSCIEQDDGSHDHYLNNASKDFISTEVEKALVALTV